MAHPVAVDACGTFPREFDAMGFRVACLGRTPTRAQLLRPSTRGDDDEDD